MRGLNYQLQFERRHAVLLLAYNLDLKLKVKYWPNFGKWVNLKFWLPSTAEV